MSSSRKGASDYPRRFAAQALGALGTEVDGATLDAIVTAQIEATTVHSDSRTRDHKFKDESRRVDPVAAAQFRACGALGRIASRVKAAVPALVLAKGQDEFADIRKAAETALKNIEPLPMTPAIEVLPKREAAAGPRSTAAEQAQYWMRTWPGRPGYPGVFPVLP